VSSTSGRDRFRLRHNFQKAFPFGPASWSRDGRRIAFSRDDGDLYVVDVDEGVSQRIGAGAAAPGTAVFSPQDDRIAFFGAGGVFTIKPDGSDQRRVWSGEVFPFGLRWSPDGRFLFIKRRNRVIDVQTGATVGELEEAGRDHVFTPDSRHIVYACCVRAPTAGPPPVALGRDLFRGRGRVGQAQGS
jgi:Tol biopolymer transport system component